MCACWLYAGRVLAPASVGPVTKLTGRKSRNYTLVALYPRDLYVAIFVKKGHNIGVPLGRVAIYYPFSVLFGVARCAELIRSR